MELHWLRAYPPSQLLGFSPPIPVKTRCASCELNPPIRQCAQLCVPFSQTSVSQSICHLGAQEHMVHLISQSSFNLPTHLGLWDPVYCALVLLCSITEGFTEVSRLVNLLYPRHIALIWATWASLTLFMCYCSVYDLSVCLGDTWVRFDWLACPI